MYFDNAATSFPKPDCVCDAVDHWMRHGAAAAGRGSHRGTDEAARMLDECRARFARLIGEDSPAQVVFTSSCTDSLNTVLPGLLKPGDRVIASTLDHNSILRPLTELRRARGVRFDLADFDPRTGLIDVALFTQLLKSEPVKLVVLTHASNVTGIVQPVQELARLAKSAGAFVLLDAAQTAGHQPLNVQELGVDFLAAAGHKGLLGPLGTGILWMRTGLESQVAPLRFGGTGTNSESLNQPLTMPERFESGNANLPGLAGLHAAAGWLLEQNVAELHRSLQDRTRQLLDGLKSTHGVSVVCGNSDLDRCGLVSFEIVGMDCRDVAMILDQSFDIRCRAGLHCAPLAHQTLGTIDRGGTVRLSPGVFTTSADVDRAVEAVWQIAATVV